MNYLAHVFLARPTVESVCGNLMGDFMKGVRLNDLPPVIQRGVLNHRMVDRFTDAHPAVKALKPRLSPARRRFSGIICDVMFDHLLIQHWQAFSDDNFTDFVNNAHQQIEAGWHYLPTEMQRVMTLMIEQDWLHSYQTLAGVEAIIERMSRRIRFENQLGGAMQEVEDLLPHYEDAFLSLFPALLTQV